MHASNDLPGEEQELIASYPRSIDPDEFERLARRRSRFTADRVRESEYSSQQREMDSLHSAIKDRFLALGYRLGLDEADDIFLPPPNYPAHYEFDSEITGRRAVNRATIDVLVPLILRAPHRYTIMIGVEILDSFERFNIMLTSEGAFGRFENAGTARKMGFDPASGRLDPPWVDRGGPPWVDPGEPLG